MFNIPANFVNKLREFVDNIGAKNLLMLKSLKDNGEITYAYGYTAYHNGDNEKAEGIFFSLTKMFPIKSKYFYALGAVQQSEEKFSLAASSYEKAVALNPSHTDAYYHLGECFIALRKFATAKKFLKTFVANVDDDNILHKRASLMLNNWKSLRFKETK